MFPSIVVCVSLAPWIHLAVVLTSQADSSKTIEVAVMRSEESKQNAIQGADRNLKEKARELELVKQQLATSRDGNSGLTKQNKALDIKNAELALVRITALLMPTFFDRGFCT
jgi:hypothetical protein